MSRFSRWILMTAVAVPIVFYHWSAYSQSTPQPTNDAPNPYNTVKNFLKMPEGRSWGSTSAVAVDKDGRSIWVAERCGMMTNVENRAKNSCVDDPTTGKMSDLATIMKFDASGKMVKSFGAGMLAFPHGIYVDKDGNIWVTDGQDNAPRAPRGNRGGGGAAGGAGAGAAAGGGGRGGGGGPQPGNQAGATVGHLVYKFNPDGKLLMTLGKVGGGADPDYFYQPNAVFVAPNGDIYVSEGHASGANANARILKFSKDGKLIRSFGKKGTGHGEFDQPHALAMDSKGRLFVADRSNNRIQIFDQDFNFIDEWSQFSRPSGIFIDTRTDTIYVADSESGSVNPAHGAWKRGIRIGSIKDGKVVAFIPDPTVDPMKEYNSTTSSAEGIAVDAAGNIWGAEVGQHDVKKYVKK